MPLRVSTLGGGGVGHGHPDLAVVLEPSRLLQTTPPRTPATGAVDAESCSANRPPPVVCGAVGDPSRVLSGCIAPPRRLLSARSNPCASSSQRQSQHVS